MWGNRESNDRRILNEARRLIRKKESSIHDLSYLRGLCFCISEDGYENIAINHIWDRLMERELKSEYTVN